MLLNNNILRQLYNHIIQTNVLRLTDYFPVLLFTYAQRDQSPKSKSFILYTKYILDTF
jgi:hypothetical protein